MNNHCPRRAQIPQHLGDQLGQLSIIDTGELMGRSRRVGQRAKKIKDGPNADFTSRLDGLSAEIQGAQLEIRCNPAELERSYAKAKELLARTNRNYVELKAQLSERVAELDAERRAGLQAREERSRAIQDQFNRLIL